MEKTNLNKENVSRKYISYKDVLAFVNKYIWEVILIVLGMMSVTAIVFWRQFFTAFIILCIICIVPDIKKFIEEND